MSSDDEREHENNSSIAQQSNARKPQRACDVCRRKKIRCDGIQAANKKCINCVNFGQECTYVEAAKKRGPPKSYMDSVNTRIERLERLLHEISPDALANLNRTMELTSLTRSQSRTPSVPKHPGDTLAVDRSLLDDNLESNMARLALNHGRFFGKSSGAMLVEKATEMKYEYLGVQDRYQREYEFATPSPTPNYFFPEHNLMISLINLYFIHMNTYLPLLHRPTFQRSVASGLHRTNSSFALTLLLVCAVGSRYSNDPRVLLDGTTSFHSCGWKWFSQVPMVGERPMAPANLYEIQIYCLVGQFLHASSVPQACWVVVGIGIRAAQDVGAHRRKSSTGEITAEDELWKRAFWVLVCMDRLFSSSCGRPCSIHDEDFDLERPIECDDEYWESPDQMQRFKQPPNRKSVITYFNSYIDLSSILASVLRTVYAVNKSKILLGFVGPQWEESTVRNLRTALSNWIATVPDHLRWDPQRENDIFFNQSASLYCFHYHIEILIHRPFIPSPRRPVPLPFPSLAICTSAARSCSHVASTHAQRFSVAPPPIQTTAFSSAIVLLLNIWGGARSGITIDAAKEMEDVHKCMDILQASESRWFMAGRLWDILYELASVGELPLPSSKTTTKKRERDRDTDSQFAGSSFGSGVTNSAGFIDIAGDISGPGIGPISMESDLRTTQQQQHEYSRRRVTPPPLPTNIQTRPMYVDDLQRDAHRQHDFTPQTHPSLYHGNKNPWYTDGTSFGGPSLARVSVPHDTALRYQDNFVSSIDRTPLDIQGIPYGQMLEPYAHFSPNSVADYHTRLDVNSQHHTMPLPQQRGSQEEVWWDTPMGLDPDAWRDYLSNLSEYTQNSYGGNHRR